MSQVDLRAARAILDRAEIERRPITGAEQAEVDRLIAANTSTLGRRSMHSAPSIQNAARFADPKQPLRSVGDFLATVRIAMNPEGGPASAAAHNRLVNAAPTTYGSEAVGPDGGYAVPPDFRAEIMRKVLGEDSLLARTDQVITESSGITVPKDETTPWGTAGVQGYWTGEGALLTQSKPVLETSTIKMHKLTTLVPVTDELLDDAPALGAFVVKRAGAAIDWRVSEAIVAGTGVGQPMGFMNSPSLITVSKETSQIAATIHGLNLVKMWARVPAAWRKSAAWLVHPDAETQLMQAGIQVGPAAAGTATAGQLVYTPADGISGSPFGTLFGRPVIPHQAMSALGTTGDIVLAALGQYASVIRSGGIKSDVSIHLFFDYDVTAFRFVFRMGGQPWWSTALADKNGSNTRSAFIALETR
jgi:HK97 family phage major capsid protein